MIKLKETHSLYLKNLNDTKQEYILKFKQAKEKQLYFYNLIENEFKDQLFNSDISLSLILDFIEEKKDIFSFRQLFNSNKDLYPKFLYIYIHNILKLGYKKQSYKSKIGLLDDAFVPLGLFKLIITANNKKIARYLLTGGEYNLGFDIGAIGIRYKSRFNSSYGIRKTINWGESLKTLKLYAENHNEETRNWLKEYNDKCILKKEFIDRMKKYTFSNDNPKGGKWLVYYTTDYNLIWWWNKYRYRKGFKKDYCFIPNNYIYTKDRSQNAFLETITKNEDIIDSDLLGNRDKLAMLKRFDNTYYLNFKKIGHDLSN